MRADLAAIAARLDIGLRAGERKYALEHLFAQDAEGMLRELGRECARQAGLRSATAERLGGEKTVAGRTILELADRATESARMLNVLADESLETSTGPAAP